jgi:hypothetical protein
MNCQILRTLYLKANGELPCEDDVGEDVVLGKVTLDPGWSIVDHFNGAQFSHIRASFQQDKEPWPDVCPRCPLFRGHETFRDEIVHRRIEKLQIEPSLACTLRCPCCSQPMQLKVRAKPHILGHEVFRQLLKSCADNGYAIECIEYCGQGEPLSHPHFSEFVRIAREIYPATWQRVITNGNYDYATKLNGQFIDEVQVSCDGVFQENYEKYRRKGQVDKPLKFMRDAALLDPERAPKVVWKYILFEFNDSDEELHAAQDFMLSAHVSELMFIVTETEFRSKRYTIDNMMELLVRAPTARIEVVPRYYQGKGVNRGGTAFRLSRRFSPRRKATFCSADYIRFYTGDVVTLNGWALAKDKADAISDIAVTVDGRVFGSPLLGVARPDVFEHLPEFNNRRTGFVLSAQRPDLPRPGSRVDIRVMTDKGRTDHHRFVIEAAAQDRITHRIRRAASRRINGAIGALSRSLHLF